ncbi:MAG: glutamate 5-kinase [Candidatus Aquicultor sp.]|nr:glutamate 5-kinase [Candidatus Aquicultor sp.]
MPCKGLNVFRNARRIVVKLGTSTVAKETGGIDHAQLKSIVEQVAQLKKDGLEVVIVSSGAIAAGVEGLGLKARPTTIPELQAAASVGQGLLLHEYARLFNEHDIKVGQVLLTQYDVIHRRQYLNSRNTLKTLLKLGVVPIVNENDATAVDEIRFGDNDTLAALVSNLIRADLLILLSDIEGLYTGDPRDGGDAKLIEMVEDITTEIESLAGGGGSSFSSGGMVTKIQAARIAIFAQVGMVIAHGRRPNVLIDIMNNERVGTFFAPRKKRLSAMKLWIAFGKSPRGSVTVDDGAASALLSAGKSLLPAGVVGCEGKFQAGDAITVKDLQGNVFAKGLTNFSSSEVDEIKGLKSSQVLEKFSDSASEEIIHRNCLVILR